MGSFLDRYMGGEYQQVWRDLQSLGAEVRGEMHLADAQAVAREIMRRAKSNIATLSHRLQVIGYRFEHSFESSDARIPSVSKPPLPDVHAKLALLEEHIGMLPLSLVACYEVIGEACFIGTHPDWPEDWLTDPLYISPIDFLIEWHVAGEDPRRAGDFPRRLQLAPDRAGKAGFSSGTYDIDLPTPEADALLHGDGMLQLFVDYLRTVFAWGGFPGLARYLGQSDPTILQLTSGLAAL